MHEPGPITMRPKSPRSTAPNHTLAPASIVTSPMRTAVDAMKASVERRGRFPSSSITVAMLGLVVAVGAAFPNAFEWAAAIETEMLCAHELWAELGNSFGVDRAAPRALHDAGAVVRRRCSPFHRSHGRSAYSQPSPESRRDTA